MKPKVSVLMPVKNNQKYVKEAILSMLGQTLSEFELLLIDDNSSDETNKILRRFESYDKRIRLVRHKKTLGLVKSLNEGLRLARAELVARMDSDDVAFDNRLMKQWLFLSQNPEVAVLGGGYVRINEQGRELGINKVETDEGFLRYLSLFYSPVAHPTVMMRKKIVLEVGGYDENWPLVEDRELWLRVWNRARITNLPEPLIKYRTHSQSISQVKKYEQLENKIRLSRKAISAYLELNEDQLACVYGESQEKSTQTQAACRYRILKQVAWGFMQRQKLTFGSRRKVFLFVLQQHPWWRRLKVRG